MSNVFKIGVAVPILVFALFIGLPKIIMALFNSHTDTGIFAIILLVAIICGVTSSKLYNHFFNNERN